MPLPATGIVSTYADRFVNKGTSNGDVYTHEGWTAALLPCARWHAVPLGHRYRVSYAGRSVVVKTNDSGAGDGSMERVLDLSRAAFAYLKGVPLASVTNGNAGLLYQASFEPVAATTPMGPVR